MGKGELLPKARVWYYNAANVLKILGKLTL